MKFKTRELRLNNVISINMTVDFKGDIFEQITEVGTELKNLLIQNDYYTDSPMIFVNNPFAESSENMTLLTTIGNAVEITGKNESNIGFDEHFEMTTNYFYRHFDQEEEIPYQEIDNEITRAGYSLVNIYHVVLDFYGDMVLDMYCEVE
jgi:hypothetical protein